MSIPILVPRRTGDDVRDQIWNYLRPKWEARGHEIFEGHHNPPEGPFNRARAVNRASRYAGDWDIALIIDADIYIEAWQIEAAAQSSLEHNALAFAHTEWWNTTPHARRHLLRGIKHIEEWATWRPRDWALKNPLSNSCAMTITRTLWDDIGGYDERFQGWGAEDWAWHVACEELGGPITRQPAPVIHLHHPLSTQARLASSGHEDPILAGNHRLGRRYLACRGNPTALRALIRDAKKVREP